MNNQGTKIEELHKKINKCSVLFFDLDGTLVDTDITNFYAYQNAINLVINTDKQIAFNNKIRFCRNNLKLHFPNISKAEYHQVVMEKEKLYNDFLSKSVINTFVKDVLLKFYKTKTTVLVTNCRKNRALETLSYHDVLDKFNKIIFNQDNNEAKRINKYQYAISKLVISPNSVIVFENEMKERNNALKAGIPAINIIKP